MLNEGVAAFRKKLDNGGYKSYIELLSLIIKFLKFNVFKSSRCGLQQLALQNTFIIVRIPDGI